MAGSWAHMTTKSGELRNNESFCGMVENLGDAYEVAEECFGMVQWLAERLTYCALEDRQHWIELAQKHYRVGLSLGGVESE